MRAAPFPRSANHASLHRPPSSSTRHCDVANTTTRNRIMTDLRPFTLEVSDETLDFIRRRVADFPWHEMPQDGGWEYGTNLDYMKELSAYWVEAYDWRRHEAVINGFDNFTAPVDGIDIHFIHEKGSGPSPMPLIITHGWPGSVTEFLDVIRPLAHPEDFGGDVADAFDVVVPSVPGFGFSGKPPRPWGPRKIASVLASLMTDVLGYHAYLAQGGDWGASICNWMGFEHAPPCMAIHVNGMGIRHPDGPQTPEEEAWAAHSRRRPGHAGRLPHPAVDQAPDPQLRHDGQPRRHRRLDPREIPRLVPPRRRRLGERLLQGRSVDQHHGLHRDAHLQHRVLDLLRTPRGRSAPGRGHAAPGRDGQGRVFWPGDQRVEVPVACALFPKELLPWPPRSYVERLFNVQRWTEFPSGGHFAAMEEPDALLQDIRAFARTLR